MTNKASVHYVTGEAQWAKLYEHNKDVFGGKEFYCVDLILEAGEADKLKASGTKLKVVKQEDGRFKVRFRRNHLNERIPEFGGPPVVINKDGEDFTALIGNGTIITLKYTVYPTAMGNGTRMEKVRIDNLVEYVRPEDSDIGNNKELPF